MDKKLDKLYSELKIKYDKYLKKYNVNLPKLKRGGKYTLNSLVLLYLYERIGKVVTKQALTDYLRSLGYDVNDVQQARHLAQQYGWYIISGTRKDAECQTMNVKLGEYMLKTIEKPYPSYSSIKRTEILDVNNWNDLKKAYGYRCATCGSKEGEPNFHYPASVTILQQGHKDPGKALTIDNTIPQCPFCNRASRNYFVFDNKGRVEKLYDPLFVLRSEKDIQKIMLKLLIENNLEDAKQIVEKLYERRAD